MSRGNYEHFQVSIIIWKKVLWNKKFSFFHDPTAFSQSRAVEVCKPGLLTLILAENERTDKKIIALNPSKCKCFRSSLGK